MQQETVKNPEVQNSHFFSYYVCSKWLESFLLFGIDFPLC